MDLVNTFDLPYQVDTLTTVSGLESFLSEHDLDGGVDAADLTRVRDLRADLRGVFEAKTDGEAAQVLNRILLEAGATPWISAHDDSPVHMHFEPVESSVSDQLAATTAMALAVVLCDFGLDRLGVCASDSCRYAFVDVSKNRRKQYCGDKCATRENVAAYRARRRATE